MKTGNTQNNQVIKDIKNTILDIAKININKLDDEIKIREELGIDSLMAIEIIAKIEKRYSIQINEEEIMKITTVGEFVEYITSKIMIIRT